MRQFSNAIKKHMVITFHMHKINLQMLIVYNPAVQWLTSPIHAFINKMLISLGAFVLINSYLKYELFLCLTYLNDLLKCRERLKLNEDNWKFPKIYLQNVQVKSANSLVQLVDKI